MGTRGAYGFRIGDVDKVSYNHFDSYPSGLGEEVVDFIKAHDYKTMALAAQRIQLVEERDTPTDEQIKECVKFSDTNVGDQSLTDWYCLLRNVQGDLSAYIDKGLRYMIDSSSFMTDSLFCEWAYIINLDTNRLEVYKGFNQDKDAPGRYAALGGKDPQPDYCYYGVELLLEIPLDDVRKLMTRQLDSMVDHKIRENKVAKGEALSDEKIQEYLDNSGVVCPYCGSRDISSTEQVQTDAAEAWQEVKCGFCGKIWKDLYKLVGIEEEE